MTDVVRKIMNVPGLWRGNGAQVKQIAAAEKTLGIKFPEEYRKYVEEFGCVLVAGHEWTGLNVNGGDNVITATLSERSNDTRFPVNVFVLESWGTDGIRTVVDEAGKVYTWQGGKLIPDCNSISEYLDYCLKDLKDA